MSDVSPLDNVLPRQSPHDLEAELSVLGGLLLLPEKFVDIDGKLAADDFFNPGYGLIFSAIAALQGEGKPIDILLLRSELERRGDLAKVGGDGALAALTDAVPTGVHVDYYADLVREKSLLRRLIAAAVEIVETASSGGESAGALVDRAEQAIMQVAERNVRAEPRGMREIMQSTFDLLQKLADKHHVSEGMVLTGYNDLDDKLTGLHAGELIIIAGRPSMGKSTLALNLARKVALNNRQGVLIFSLEMTAQNMATNILAAHAKIDAGKLRKPENITNDEWQEIGMMVGELGQANIIIDDASLLSIAEIRGKARRVKQKHEVNLIVIDYLQLMQGSAAAARRSREQEVAEISRGLKALAKELSVPVIALSQLNRKAEDRSGNRPVLSDLRESGAIEQDADVVMLLHRPCYYDENDHPGEAEVIIAKQRNGPTGTVNLSFLNHQLRFEPLSRIHQEGE
ncbi:replicative DNA helicase [Planctomycetales bacterium]|nr:replicative DNA helicase [Planctomycetales bacterium]GHS98429.1 replicative DNA helicase [Planctomycetales bacterium]GHT05920.1 replicative DNA helicase [Planctomycetales bacterium]GHV18640.1 replicative DNA helicase [Planctomycetales bacterium]